MSSLSRSQLFGFVFIGFIIIAALVYFTMLSSDEAYQEPSTAATMAPGDSSAVGASTSITSSPISPVSPLSSPTALTFDPEEAEQQVQQGINLYEAGQYEAAIEIFDDLLARNSIDVVSYNVRGSAYMALGELNKALADFSEAIKLEPSFPFAFYNRGRVYVAQEKYDDAVADLQKSIELSPDEFGYRANGNIGVAYFRQGKFDQALQAFEEAISFDSSKADTYYHRGETHTALEDFETAISDYQAAIDRFTDYDEAYQGLGFAYYKIGNLDSARQALEQALEISPDSPVAHFYLGLVELAEDRPDLANENITQAASTVDSLPAGDMNFVLNRVSVELERFAQQNPDQSQAVDALLNLLP